MNKKLKTADTLENKRRRLGQFFTPPPLVEKCLNLVQNKGRLLEPSCGDGAFLDIYKKGDIFIEIDKNVVFDKRIKVMNFFDLPVAEKFSTIIGNPPYVDNSLFKVNFETNIKVKANLYIYFIEKCFHHLEENGELIFIVPRDFIKLTSARYINKLLFDNGTITHFYDYGDEKFFKNASPNICIFRYQKSNFSRKTLTFNGEFKFTENDGIISFTKGDSCKRLGDIFDVKVGAVAGNDSIFENDDGIEMVFSKTVKTGKTKKVIFNTPHPSLIPYRDKLLSRKIKKFTNENWWSWGRVVNFREDENRIYVNVRTRNKKPFFIHACKKWDGSVLALFPKDKNMDMIEALDKLNSIDWESAGFMTGGRYIFGVKSLMEAQIEWRD